MNINKLVFDNVLVILFSFIWIPMIIILGIFKIIIDGRPILFKQSRTGYKGTPFMLYKFCTMNNLKDRDGKLLDDKDRLTRLGKFMRKYSLDELPGLFNVLTGDMS